MTGKPDVPKCFDRNARLWGAPNAGRLAAARVMILGLGGVGSYAAEALARAGVGTMLLVDFDQVCITNVNRQLHALPSTVGRSKVELMHERLHLINPEASVEHIEAFYEAKTSASMLAWKPDVIVDAIDNVTAKLHLLATCILRGVPIVTSLGASGKTDPTRVRFADLRKTHEDPLAKTIRKNLWRVYRINLKRVSSLMAVFSDETPVPPSSEYTSSLCGLTCVCPNSKNQHHTCARRHVIWGSSVFVTASFGLTAGSLVVRFLTGDPAVSLQPTFKVLEGDDPPIDPATLPHGTAANEDPGDQDE